MSNTNSYESPFCTRYASEEMQYIFSADKKFTTWRRLWVALARAEMKLGLPVTEAQVKQLEENIDNIDKSVIPAFFIIESRREVYRIFILHQSGFLHETLIFHIEHIFHEVVPVKAAHP